MRQTLSRVVPLARRGYQPESVGGSRTWRRWLWMTLLGSIGCGSSQYPDIDEPMPAGFTASTAPSSAPHRPPGPPRVSEAGTLKRADVERVVDAGLGRFLSQIAIEPALSGGKFTGWSIVSMQPPELWRTVDLKPGDVVTRINGMAIEREVEAYDAFQAVRQAPTLEISYVRQGQLRALRYTIIGPPSLPPRVPTRDKPPPG
jgi:hypothetical protein